MITNYGRELLVAVGHRPVAGHLRWGYDESDKQAIVIRASTESLKKRADPGDCT